MSEKALKGHQKFVSLLMSNEDIEEILRSVPMKATVAEDRSWRCRHWVWDALTVSLGFDKR
jgi:hypothetical protein